MDIALVYVTCGDRGEAQKIAEILVSEKLAACGNIIDGVGSCYLWHGETANDDEVILLLKTTRNLREQLAARVIDLHSYDIPCVLEIAASCLNPKYLDWIENSTK